MIGKCKICGKEFYYAKGRTFTCSPECSYKNKKLLDKKNNKNINTRISTSINDLARKARESGMSYGEYVAKMGV